MTKLNDLVKNLNECGAIFKAYQRNPAPGLNFVIRGTQNRDMIRLWMSEKADVDVSYTISKKFKQAVITVKEKGRSFTRDWVINTDFIDEKSQDELIEMYKGYTRSNIVADGKISYDVEVIEPLETSSGRYDSWNDCRHINHKMKMKITVKISGSTNCFLVGVDENAHFISQLPKIVKSVSEAHEVLKPANLKGRYLRQGEWFFEEVNKKDQAVIEKEFTNKVTTCNPSDRDQYFNRDLDGRVANGRWVSNLSHIAQTRFVRNRKNGETYVRGYVYDNANSRSVNKHKPLYLGKWYRLYKNREKNASAQQQNVYFD